MSGRMPRWLPFLLTVVFFTIAYLLDIWSTSFFLRSPNCIESNPLFAPFSNSPLLLGQMYFASWFIVVGISGYVHLLSKQLGDSWMAVFSWYILVCVLGLLHLTAVVHNLSMLGVCWA